MEKVSFESVSATLENAKVKFSFPGEIVPDSPSGEKIPPSPSRGTPRMFAVCLGNATNVKHFYVGATLPEWSKFPEFKEICKQARAVRFGDYEAKISAAAGMLRGFLKEEEEGKYRELA